MPVSGRSAAKYRLAWCANPGWSSSHLRMNVFVHLMREKRAQASPTETVAPLSSATSAPIASRSP